MNDKLSVLHVYVSMVWAVAIVISALFLSIGISDSTPRTVSITCAGGGSMTVTGGNITIRDYKRLCNDLSGASDAS